MTTVCASCLLEDADFGDDDDSVGAFCENGNCTVTGHAGSCTYPQDDNAARDACIRQVYPRREVACEVDFEPVSECANVCA